MTGTVAAVGVVACAALLTAGLATAGAATVTARRVAAVADAAALAAADAASGAIAGTPCELADEVAAASGASIVDCDLDGLVATVRVTAPFGALAAAAVARAGPPAEHPATGPPTG